LCSRLSKKSPVKIGAAKRMSRRAQ